jgi:hypothetical protein
MQNFFETLFTSFIALSGSSRCSRTSDAITKSKLLSFLFNLYIDSVEKIIFLLFLSSKLMIFFQYCNYHKLIIN